MHKKYKTYVDLRVDILRQEERLYFFKGTLFNVLVKLDRSVVHHQGKAEIKHLTSGSSKIFNI